MRRVKWRAVWLVCWAAFLIADMIFDLRARLSALVVDTEKGAPGLFHSRLQTILLVIFVAVALSPLLWPLAKRWFLKDKLKEGQKAEAPPIDRDPRDASLAEALGYLVDRSAWGAGSEAGQPVDARLREAATMIEEAARRGRLDIRGVPPGGAARRSITADHWLTAGIDLDGTLDPAGTGGRTVARDAQAADRVTDRGPAFDHLVIDREALERLWPPDSAWRRTGRATVRGVRKGLRRRGAGEKA
ncbi:MAG: hypothetical protein RLT05_24870 [Bauldia litoralis]